MNKPTNTMTPTELLDEFRDTCTAIGLARASKMQTNIIELGKRADLLEQELTRRIAW